MSINSTEAVPPGLFAPPATADPASSTSNSSSTSKTTDDKQMFLQLLVAQLRYQDPMKPTDSSQFLTQTAQFNALEQMQAVATQTANLLASSTAFGATNLIGRDVSYALPDGTTTSATVTGVSYNASGPVLSLGSTDISLSQVLAVQAQAGA